MSCIYRFLNHKAFTIHETVEDYIITTLSCSYYEHKQNITKKNLRGRGDGTGEGRQIRKTSNVQDLAKGTE